MLDREKAQPMERKALNGNQLKVIAMAAHRAEKPNGFPFGGFVKIGPDEMRAILHLAE